MPCAPIAFTSSMVDAVCNSAFDGMQPTLRQTPPSVAYRSTRTVFIPRSAARHAAEYPPGPDPSTSISHSMSKRPEYDAAVGPGAAGGAATGAGAPPPPAAGALTLPLAGGGWGEGAGE